MQTDSAVDPKERARAAARARADRTWRTVGVILAAGLLFVVGLLPRTANLDQHATADEDLTLIRSANVALAIESRDWWGTYQIGHPEATVQLAVALGLGPDALRPYAGDFLGPDSRTAARVPGYFDTLVRARALMAPIHAALVVVAALLAWRMWGSGVGLLAGLLLALEPFLVAHGRILRTDALLAELMLVAVLGALTFWSGRAGAWALVVCTIATALALLTKTPALALLGAVPVAAVAGWLGRSPTSRPAPPCAGEGEQSAGGADPARAGEGGHGAAGSVPLRAGEEGQATAGSVPMRAGEEGQATAGSVPMRAGEEGQATAGSVPMRAGEGEKEGLDESNPHGHEAGVAGGPPHAKTARMPKLSALPSFAESQGRDVGAGPERACEPKDIWADQRLRGRGLVSAIVALAGWAVGSAALVYALWPAMWARPLRAIERMVVYTQEKGGSPMDAGGFFLGAAIPDPGPLYYAVALPLRVGPLLLIGVALWLLLRAPRARQGAGLVLLVGLGLAVVLAFLPKKADRYVLPAIPFLVVVAAVGIAAAAERWRYLNAAGALGLVAVVETASLLVVWPYPLAAYNPLVGGGQAAERWISVGWGEGLDQLAPILNDRPDADLLTVSTPYPEVLQGQIVGRAVDLDAFDRAEYVVRYVAASQRHLGSATLDAALSGREPLKRVEIAGIPYAELYELDHPTFAGNLEVRQIEVSPTVTPRRGWVTVRFSLGPPGAEGRLDTRGLTPFVTPLDVEVVLASASDPSRVEATVTRSLLPDGSISEVKLRAPNGLGKYVLGLSVKDAATGAQYAVTSWPVGAPRLRDRLVYPSLGVRVQ